MVARILLLCLLRPSPIKPLDLLGRFAEIRADQSCENFSGEGCKPVRKRSHGAMEKVDRNAAVKGREAGLRDGVSQSETADVLKVRAALSSALEQEPARPRVGGGCARIRTLDPLIKSKRQIHNTR